MLTALIACRVFDAFFATALTIAYRMNRVGAAERLGGRTPGDDYLRLVPLMEAVPWWLHALWVLAGVLYLIAATGVVVNPTPSAIATIVIPFVLPLALALVLWQSGRTAPPRRVPRQREW